MIPYVAISICIIVFCVGIGGIGWTVVLEACSGVVTKTVRPLVVGSTTSSLMIE
jgi:hypothetical protein